MWTNIFDSTLNRRLKRGAMTVTFADGHTRNYGDGRGEPIEVELKDPNFPRNFVLNPDLATGEAYMAGTLVVKNDDLEGLLTFALKNRAKSGTLEASRGIEGLRSFLGRFKQINPIGRSKQNVAHHYDLSEELYDLFLDDDRQYSCAYYKSETDTLEQAQEQKKRHIAGKLLLSPGMRVLDIGCGWGGMALTLAKDFGANVVGVTLSEEQFKMATKRVVDAGLTGQIDIRLQDYRSLNEKFDRIVSVGMFEHVGAPQFRTYFKQVRSMLTSDGVALIHTIGRTTPPGATSPWIDKYIFPGGYAPSLSEVMQAVEKEDLYPTDIEVWRLHYAKTLGHWRERFEAQIDKARDLYDDRFCRMWRYYLTASELTFHHDHQCVFQVQLARDQRAVPLTRDYLYVNEAAVSEATHIRAAE